MQPGNDAAMIISQFMQPAGRTANEDALHPRLFPNRNDTPRSPYGASQNGRNQELAAARAGLANACRHSNDSSMVLSSARRQQHNHRDECDEQYNFHEVAPSNLLGATARE
jgi:hypothetical protein